MACFNDPELTRLLASRWGGEGYTVVSSPLYLFCNISETQKDSEVRKNLKE